MSVELDVRVDGIEEFYEKMEKVNVYMQRQVQWKLRSLGEDINITARRLCPVKTGYLRSTIYSEIFEWVLKVGARAPYAYFVEFGTHFMRGFFFLTEAINLHLPRLAQVVSEGIDWAIREARGY